MHPPLPPPIARLALVAALALAPGCAVGPDYGRPELETPDAWHQALVEGLVPGASQLEAWWTLLGDPQLSSLVERAAEENLDVRVAFERIAEARARRGIATGEWFPGLEGAASSNRSQASSAVAFLPGVQDAPLDLYSVGLGAAWEIDLFGRIRRSVEAADADLETATEDYRDLLVVLYAEVASSYVEVRAFQKRIEFALRNIQAQEDTLELVRVRNRVGLVGDLDLRQAELNVERSRSFLPALRESLAASVHRVAVLVGSYPEALWVELEQPQPVPLPEFDVAVGVPANLLRQRPDVRAAERALAAQTARVGVATSDLYPRLSLLGSISLDARSTGALWSGDAAAWSFGPQLRWDIFAGGAIRSNIRAQEALTRQSLASYEQTVLLAVEDTENALAAYTNERERLHALERSSLAASRSVELVKTLYKTGLVDFLNVLDSERSLFEEQDLMAESEGNVTRNLIRVYRALGGGWTP